MLYDIKINADLHTEIATTGRHINVVLAAGEIKVRVRLKSGSVFETKLISGMSFEVPVGFVSVAFTAENNQQIKIWLSELPLNYTPLELKTVGASALSQSTKNVFFGQVTELVPAKVGRGKVTLQSDKLFKIGGVGSTLNNTITVNAGEHFSLSTQSPIYAHSLDKDDIPIEISKFTVPLQTNKQSGSLDTILDMYFNHVLGELMVFRSFGVGFYRLKQDMSAFIGAMPNSSGFKIYYGTGKIVGDTFEIFGVTGSALIKRIYNLTDYSINDVVLTGAQSVSAANHHSFVGNNFCVTTGANGGDNIFYGNLTDGITNVVNMTTLPFTSKIAQNVFINKDGAIAINTYDGVAVTADFGATWVTNTTTFENGIQMANDFDLGRIYAAQGSDVVYSADGGLTYNETLNPTFAGTAPATINKLIANGGNLIALTPDGVLYYDKAFKQWHTFNTQAIIGGNMTAIFFASANNGKMYLTTQNTKSIIEFVGEVDTIGGLSVSIMEELN